MGKDRESMKQCCSPRSLSKNSDSTNVTRDVIVRLIILRIHAIEVDFRGLRIPKFSTLISLSDGVNMHLLREAGCQRIG